jgi:hypothetical protein
VIDDVEYTVGGNSAKAAFYPSMSGGPGAGIGTTAYRMFGRYIATNIRERAPSSSGAAGNGAVAICNSYNGDVAFIDEVFVGGSLGDITCYGNPSSGGVSMSVNIGKLTVRGAICSTREDYLQNIFDYCNIGKLDMDVNYFANGIGTSTYVAILQSANVTVGEFVLSGKMKSTTSAALMGIVSAGATVDVIRIKEAVFEGFAKPINDGCVFANTPLLILDAVDGTNQDSSMYMLSLGNSQAYEISVNDVRATKALFNFYGTNAINMDFSNIRTGSNPAFINIESNINLINPQSYLGMQRATPSAGGNVLLQNKTGYQRQIIAPSTTLATLSLSLPANPINGEVLELSFTQAITALTVSGGSLAGVGSGVTAGFGGKWIYSAADTAWLKFS